MLVNQCCTVDQGKAVSTFLHAILSKSRRGIVALAARGRGKSAALGLAMAGAIDVGYPKIYVTAPSPENLKTLFAFVCKGFNAMDYEEHTHYDVVRSSIPEFNKATVQINVHKKHQQTIQYIEPHENEELSKDCLLIIDEAAAIPLAEVKALLGVNLIFISSTLHGYEGTGNPLTLNLLQSLEDHDSGPFFRTIYLTEPVRYAVGDSLETWLNLLYIKPSRAIS